MSQKRSVAIIGAGQTGVSAAVGFLNAGFDVTLFSDRDRERLRNDGPATGTAVTFAVAQAAERELGLDDYLGRAPRVTGQSTQVFSGSGADREDGLDFDVEYDGVRAAGVDTRLKVDDRIGEFLSRGGRFVVSVITADSLDDVAAAHDLTLVATGRAGLSELFAVDHSRTVWREGWRAQHLRHQLGAGRAVVGSVSAQGRRARLVVPRLRQAGQRLGAAIQRSARRRLGAPHRHRRPSRLRGLGPAGDLRDHAHSE
jgi:hypothetical protein